jgi:AraC-like DNA-binding protein
VGFLTEAHQPEVHHCGRVVSADDLVVENSDVQHLRTGGNSRFAAMSLTTADLDAACKAITGCEYEIPSFKHFIRPSPALRSHLLGLHAMAGQMARTTPTFFDLPEVVRALEQQLIHAMVRCLTESVTSKFTAGGCRHDQIVARFEEFLEAHSDAPLHLTEICAAIGVAERTLRVACKEHLGMGPIRYLHLRRMHLVRRALKQADPSTATVTRLATDYGFWELGHFSIAYNRQPFLNRPSSLTETSVSHLH